MGSPLSTQLIGFIAGGGSQRKHVLLELTLSFYCKCFEKENTLKLHRDTAVNTSSK